MAGPAAQAMTDRQQRDAHLVNHTRLHHGVHRVDLRKHASRVAERWARHMAKTGVLAHNDISASFDGWSCLGQNIAYGSSLKNIQHQFKHSPDHLAIMLDPDYNRLGTGVAWGHGKWWVVQDYIG
jgi:uncharacterized protein YkwD